MAACSSQEIGPKLIKALGLPARVVSLNLRLHVGEIVSVDCTFYPEKDAFDDDGELMTAFKSYELVEKEESD